MVELLEGAVLALAHTRLREDEQDDHYLKKNSDEAGDEEVCRARRGIVEDRGAYFDRHLRVAEDAGEGLLEGDAGRCVDKLVQPRRESERRL